jgi:hypothetical protein
MGSTIMLYMVGAEGSWKIWKWGLVLLGTSLQQQKRMTMQKILPPIMAPGEVKIQWLRMLSWASTLASFIIVSSSWIRTSVLNLPAILVLSWSMAEMTTSLLGCWNS